jgi:hypothetical protein
LAGDTLPAPRIRADTHWRACQEPGLRTPFAPTRTAVASKGIDDVTDPYAKIIDGLSAQPVLIGHSFGGLIAEKLLGMDRGAAAIAIDASQIEGVLQLLHHREYRMTLALAPAYNPGSWSTFFVLTGTVAATLTGLFFVAFSLRVRDLQLSVVIRTRAAYLLVLLVVIVVYSAFVLMPGQSRAAVAAEILIVSVLSLAYLCGWCLPRLLRLAVFSVDLVVRWTAGVTGLLLGIGAGISLLIGNGGGLYFLAFGALLLIANEVASAWSLIVGIGKDTGAKDIMLVGQLTPEGPPAGQLAAEEDGSRAVPGQ